MLPAGRRWLGEGHSMELTYWWRRLNGEDTSTPRRRFMKAWWGGWWTRAGLIAGASLFLGAGRASSPATFILAVMTTAGFLTAIMVMGMLNNYAELKDDGVLISQMGIVTPGGPTYAGGTISYRDVVGVRFIAPRSVHIRYNGKDWRRKPTVRTTKLYLEHADEFVDAILREVERVSGVAPMLTRN
jgi:hypothetical protein